VARRGRGAIDLKADWPSRARPSDIASRSAARAGLIFLAEADEEGGATVRFWPKRGKSIASSRS